MQQQDAAPDCDFTVVLDDDPTGTQLAGNISIALDSDGLLGAIRPGDRAVHVLTNSRAFSPADARALVARAGSAARAAVPGARVILRGDSTLRGHMLEEYDGLVDALALSAAAPPLLLVPALPSAGRVTRGTSQLLLHDGHELAVSESEYARDGMFTFTTSHLADWAQERSAGRFRSDDARVIGLAELRAEGGARLVAEEIIAATLEPRPVVVVPDAEVDDDLRVIAAGLRLAEAEGARLITRCSPAFATILTETAARGPVEMPVVDRLLVVSGSFVATTTRQLEGLERWMPGVRVTAATESMARGDSAEIERIVHAATAAIDRCGLAVIATPGKRDPAVVDAGSQRAIAASLSRAASAVACDMVIAKGGITSAVIARDGFGAEYARIEGPVRAGVALWLLDGTRPFVVVPGNVGDDRLLVELVDAALRKGGSTQEVSV